MVKVEQIKSRLRREAKRIPHASSDILVWDNIAALWRAGHDTLLFNVDAPRDLRREGFVNDGIVPLFRARRSREFWTKQYVRETIMARHIERIIGKYSYSKRKQLTVAVFLQSFHWRHVRFLLTHPSKERIWRYYFGRFPTLTPDEVARELKSEYPILRRYWKKYAVFGAIVPNRQVR